MGQGGGAAGETRFHDVQGQSWGGHPSDSWSPAPGRGVPPDSLSVFPNKVENECKVQHTLPHVTTRPLQS